MLPIGETNYPNIFESISIDSFVVLSPKGQQEWQYTLFIFDRILHLMVLNY